MTTASLPCEAGRISSNILLQVKSRAALPQQWTDARSGAGTKGDRRYLPVSTRFQRGGFPLGVSACSI